MSNLTKYLLLSLLSLGLLSACNESANKTEKSASVEKSRNTSNSKEQEVEEKVILFFGNSLTAGYQLQPEEAFSALIQNRLDSLGYDYNVVNAGVSGETTAGGNSRIDWVLQQQDIDIFMLELGGNDGLRGIPVQETTENLKSIIDKVRAKDPSTEIILAGMMIPPNMGADYSNNFKNIFPKVAKEKEVTLLPFLLKDVAGETSLNLNDGIHPNAKGHKIVAENVWEVLQPMLEK